MNKEIEIVVRVRNPKKVEKDISRIAIFVRETRQVDKYFVPKDKDFFKEKLVNEFLRVRYDGDKSHVNYSYCHFDKDNHYLSADEYESVVENPEDVEELLKRIGMIHKVTVDKTRKYFEYEHFEITLDYIKGLGYFIEIEAKKDFGGAEKTRDKCYETLNKLNINYEACSDMSYPERVLEKENGVLK